MKIDGRCHCGYVSFEAEADPETTTLCNCTDCQTISGAPLRAVIGTRPPRSCSCRVNRRSIGRHPIAASSARKAFARNAAQRSIRLRLAMIQRFTTSGSAPCASAMN